MKIIDIWYFNYWAICNNICIKYYKVIFKKILNYINKIILILAL